MASVEVNQMLAAAAAACDEKKGEDIRILALDPSESGLTDYFLICTGNNDRQTVAITDEIELRLKRDFQTLPNSVEGRRQGEWVLMDYVDFIVHVFLPEKRAFYGLERLRKSATTLSVGELNDEITSAIKAKRPGARVSAAEPKDKPAKRAAKKSAVKKPGAKKAGLADAKAKKNPSEKLAVDEPAMDVHGKAADGAPLKRAAKKTAGKKAAAKKAVARKTTPSKSPARRQTTGE